MDVFITPVMQKQYAFDISLAFSHDWISAFVIWQPLCKMSTMFYLVSGVSTKAFMCTWLKTYTTCIDLSR